MNVIVVGEFSGRVRDAFIRHGHNAESCDLLPSESDLGPHLQCDARTLNYSRYDLAICHPECTYIANSGVRWLWERAGRWQKMIEAAEFFRWCLSLPVPRIGTENPIPHKYALAAIGQRYTQIIQPWQFGHGETKATCLWLKGLPKLTPTNIVDGRYGRVWREAPSDDRGKNRSRTYEGIAEAMASQWGSL